MKIRNMWTDNSDNCHQCEPLKDKHSETMQDGYFYRVSDLMREYSQDELLRLEKQSKLAFESVENKLFYDEMNPADVERVRNLKEEKANAELKAKEHQANLDALLADYVSGKLQKVEPTT